MPKNCEDEFSVRSAHKRIDHGHPARNGFHLEVLGVEARRTHRSRDVDNRSAPWHFSRPAAKMFCNERERPILFCRERKL